MITKLDIEETVRSLIKDLTFTARGLKYEDKQTQREFLTISKASIDNLKDIIVKLNDNINIQDLKLKYKEKTSLELFNKDLLKELLIINTNENSLDKLANLIVDKISSEKQINKETTKKGILKLLYLTKETTGLIKGISGDTVETITNLRKIIEEVSGLSSIKDFLNF